MRRRISLWLRRHTRQCRFAGVVLMLGMAYFLITQLTPFRIPCLFQKITGFACPGCGISHFCIRLLHLDIPGAARENLAIAVLAPIWLGAASSAWCGIRTGLPKTAGRKSSCSGAVWFFCCCSAWCGICPIWSSSCPPTSGRMRRSPSVRCLGAKRNFPAFFRI